MSISRGPLAGVRILDFSRLLPGPYCTQLLADMGARVTKLENLDTRGDPLRRYPPLASDGNGAMFHALNRGKSSVALPFRDPSTPGKVKELLRNTDVVVESFKPGTFEKLIGCEDIEELLREFPHLVVCRMSGYGQGCSDAGHDLNFVASAGVLGMIKKENRQTPLPVQWTDLAGGSWPAALQIVAALYERDCQTTQDRGGVGEGEGGNVDQLVQNGSTVSCTAERLLDVNMAVGAHAALVLPLARRAVETEEGTRALVGDGRDFLSRGSACYGVFECGCGGHLAVGALEPHFWDALCEATGVEGSLEDAMKSHAPGGGSDQSEGGGGGRGGREGEGGGGATTVAVLREAMAAALRSRTAEEWRALLAAKGVPATMVVEPEDAAAHLETLTGTAVTLEVCIPPCSSMSTNSSPLSAVPSGEQREKASDGLVDSGKSTLLQLPRMPLSLGTPSSLPGPSLGSQDEASCFSNNHQNLRNGSVPVRAGYERNK
mmetsp:Transcript_77124/g.151060  ORF Transcript_77124/g.151060 Transcript_77124/m.151060 type:complete len:490 (+) Transcript_77124:81-1550(+)